MEIKIIQCPNGHFYNPAMSDACPVCGAKGQDFPKTTPPGTPVGASAQGNFPKTQPPKSFSDGGSIGRTAPVEYGSSGAISKDWDNKTVIGGQSSCNEVVPVVGWLVCIEGELRGVDFRLHEGYNYIGREEGDVHIHGDDAISREKAARISYYSKKRAFNVDPADGRNIIELNGEPIYGATPINSYDVLTVGNTKLMLVAMCSEQFGWDEEEAK